jgi:hypothetical protein
MCDGGTYLSTIPVRANLSFGYSIKDAQQLRKLMQLKRQDQTLTAIEVLWDSNVDTSGSEPAEVVENLLLALDCPAMLGYRFSEIEKAAPEDKEAMMSQLLNDISHDVLWRQLHFEALIHMESDSRKIIDALLGRGQQTPSASLLRQKIQQHFFPEPEKQKNEE